MKDSLYLSLAEVVLFLQTVDHRSDIRAVLDSAGYSAAVHAEGVALLDRGREVIVEVVEEIQTDTTVMHLVHAAATELEQWVEIARFASRSLHEPERGLLAGRDIHHEDHTLSVIAHALRFLAIARNSEELRGDLGDARALADLLQRGNTLLVKALRLARGSLSPKLRMDEARALADPVNRQTTEWLERVGAIGQRALGNSPVQLGALGLLAAGAAPLGGVAGNVTRHENAQRHAPVDGPSPADPGWSVGRQGRNRLNVGRGFH